MTTEAITSEDRNAILAGLRLLQLFNDRTISAPGIDDVLTNGGDEEPLTNEVSDDLCERINCEGLSFGDRE